MRGLPAVGAGALHAERTWFYSTMGWWPTSGQFRRARSCYDPWPYLPVLMKKFGALRNGARFKDWDLPPALTQVRIKLKQHADGDRQFVKVLAAVLDHGLAAVEAACAEALEAGIASGDAIRTVLARRQQPLTPPSITTPDALRLRQTIRRSMIGERSRF